MLDVFMGTCMACPSSEDLYLPKPSNAQSRRSCPPLFAYYGVQKRLRATGMSSSVAQVIGPGDPIAALPDNGEVRVGAGVIAEEKFLRTVRAGVPRQTRNGKIWTEGRSKRYIPCVGDNIIGMVVERHSDNLIVDIGGPFHAVLNSLAFEGATRRNRPKLVEGDLVYARVTLAHKDVDTELSCTEVSGKAGGFGPLKDGLTIICSSALARRLLASPPAPVLAALGQSLKYEIAIGQNGRIWIDAPASASTVLIANAIERSEFLREDQVRLLVQRLTSRMEA